MTKDVIVKAITEIGEWSRRNFGEQEGDGLKLGRIAPLLGVVEEFGEYYGALKQEEYLDAIGDLVIFLADYLLRSGWSADAIADLYEEYVSPKTKVDPYVFFWSIGHLCKAELKRVQGIRGMLDEEAYRKRQRMCVVNIVHWAAAAARTRGSELGSVLLTTWETVCRRDWKKHPETGVAEHA